MYNDVGTEGKTNTTNSTGETTSCLSNSGYTFNVAFFVLLPANIFIGSIKLKRSVLYIDGILKNKSDNFVGSFSI